ncbi:PREDICTED: venom carboxylesterase-6-like [Nicrophorus vespilloides]|uniref:Carboxylic ester hydrolase n=1 Tax=Nicrophorus vespilloides TaxID=110193 RepID=A0ABM1NAQ6_NICVS|nr:PREDICTED: venom carboxylesterase-6-like [Nicrophorus vespilloides]
MRKLLVVITSLLAAIDADLLVTTHNGQIQGKSLKIKSGKEIRAFLGVRYAKPPIGELRFMPPQQLGKWIGIQYPNGNHPICTQLDLYTPGSTIQGEEDCLFLNIYTPKVSSKLLPVMVYIHGGGFLSGSGSSTFYGPDSLMNEDVVLVAINYRLGALGFLSTGDEVVPGNNGLKDQNVALRWVQEHIKYFGGDPTQITIFGESAGGASVHFHVISSLSKGLFHAAISQSGTSVSPWSYMLPKEAYDFGRKLATILDCPTECSKAMIKCLQSFDAKRFPEVQDQFLFWDIDPLALFTPVIEIKHEGSFISEYPEDIIRDGKSNQVPWMTGVTKDEGAFRTTGLSAKRLFDKYYKDFDRIAPFSLFYGGRVSSEKEYTKKIREYYFGKGFSETQTKNLYTDRFFFEGAEKAINLHRKYSKAPLYYYLFAYRGAKSMSAVFGDKINDHGVCHADDLLYLFPLEDTFFNGEKQTVDDKAMTKMLSKLWTNFAIHKQPTLKDSNWSHTHWKPVQTEENEYFYIGGPKEFRMDKQLYNDRFKFWKDMEVYLKTHNQRDEL